MASTIDGVIVARATLTRKHAARIIRNLSDALIDDGDISIEIRLEDNITSFTRGERDGTVYISTVGGRLLGGTGTITESHISYRDDSEGK